MFENLRYDINNIYNQDPAAKSKIEVLLLYPCIHALIGYRIANFLYKKKIFFSTKSVDKILF